MTDALWRAWEHLRLDGATGISVWFKDHADHHMSVLLDPRGPFYKCDTQWHREPNTWSQRRPLRAGFPTYGRYLPKRPIRNSDGLYCPQSGVRYGETGTPYKHSERVRLVPENRMSRLPSEVVTPAALMASATTNSAAINTTVPLLF